jgi:hypothetical protein
MEVYTFDNNISVHARRNICRVVSHWCSNLSYSNIRDQGEQASGGAITNPTPYTVCIFLGFYRHVGRKLDVE